MWPCTSISSSIKLNGGRRKYISHRVTVRIKWVYTSDVVKTVAWHYYNNPANYYCILMADPARSLNLSKRGGRERVFQAEDTTWAKAERWEWAPPGNRRDKRVVEGLENYAKEFGSSLETRDWHGDETVLGELDLAVALTPFTGAFQSSL